MKCTIYTSFSPCNGPISEGVHFFIFLCTISKASTGGCSYGDRESTISARGEGTLQRRRLHDFLGLKFVLFGRISFVPRSDSASARQCPVQCWKNGSSPRAIDPKSKRAERSVWKKLIGCLHVLLVNHLFVADIDILSHLSVAKSSYLRYIPLYTHVYQLLCLFPLSVPIE